ncbi:MAG: hypothetical protein ACYC0Q_09415 [Eubacteriales bacterium]
MAYNQNFPYFQQSLIRNYPTKAEVKVSEVITGNNNVIEDQKSDETVQNTSEAQEVEKQDNFNNDADENNTPENAEIPGFEQVGPGYFQFKNSSGTRPVFPPLPSRTCKQEVQQQAKIIPPQASAGFNRVNGLPGPYQNFPAPVYQFT